MMTVLKWLRRLTAGTIFTLITLFFLGLGGGCGLLERIQIVPALLACAVLPIAFWVVATVLFGRVYCAAVCPLGVLQDVLLFLARLGGRRRLAARPACPQVRYACLVIFAGVVVVCGASLASLLDPYGTFGRMASALFQPLAELVNNMLADWLGVDGAIVLFKREVFLRSASGLVLAASSFVLLAGLVAWKGRLVCNTICPVGTMLAVLGRKSAFRITIDPAKCIGCGKCSTTCRALCLDGRNKTVDDARCVRCFTCGEVCAQGAISFAPAWKLAPQQVNQARRDFLGGMLTAGAAASAASGAACALGYLKPGAALPPPGATGISLRTQCTACGLCVAACPQKVIVPSRWGELGALTFMLPKLDFTKGFCDPNCTTCGTVCPTGAIRPLTVAAKKQVKVGIARLDRTKCLAMTEKLPCGLCSRRCPQQAIELKEEPVDVHGKKQTIKMPQLKGDLCIGCGKCVNYCPAAAWNVILRPARYMAE